MKEFAESEEIILNGLEQSMSKDFDGYKNKGSYSMLGADQYRRQMIERIKQLPPEIQKMLREDRAQVSDKTYWSIKELEGTATEILQKNQKQAGGVTNMDDAELPENSWYMIWGAYLLYSGVRQKRFDELFPWYLADSNYMLKMGNRELIGKNGVDDFQDPLFGYDIQKPFGLYVFSNVKLLKPKLTLSFKIEDSPETMTGFVKLKLRGIEIKPY